MSNEIAPDPHAPIPRHLFKYRSLRGDLKDYVRDLVVDQKFYMASPPTLNDPFEFNPVIDLSATDEQKRRYVRGAMQRLHGDRARSERRLLAKSFNVSSATGKGVLAMSYRTTMDQVGVFSMSAKPLDLLMWPHYADNHAGICVQLAFWGFVTPEFVPMPVIYRRERPTTNPLLDTPEAMLEKAALTKGLPWAYEQEWRIVLNRQGGQLIKFETPVVSGVILGARIKPSDRDDVLGWARACRRPMEVFQAFFHETDYALEMKPLPL